MHPLGLDTRRRSDAAAGALTMAPLLVAYAPFALVIGSVVATVDDPLAGWAGSWLIYGGSAHLAALRGLAQGSVPAAIVTALLLHARLLVYGASMAPRWRAQPRWFRIVAPALLIDPTWALAERQAEVARSPAAERHFYLGAATLLGVGWSATMAVGALVGTRLPHVGLELVAPLCLLSLVGPRLRERPPRWAALAAAPVAVVTAHWPAGLGTLLAIAAGCIAGGLASRSLP